MRQPPSPPVAREGDDRKGRPYAMVVQICPVASRDCASLTPTLARRGAIGEGRRTFLLAFSIGLCYNAPRCRVSISAIIVASQASEAGSTPVPCSRKKTSPLDWSFFNNICPKGKCYFISEGYFIAKQLHIAQAILHFSCIRKNISSSRATLSRSFFTPSKTFSLVCPSRYRYASRVNQPE